MKISKRNPYNWPIKVDNKKSGQHLKKILQESNAQHIKLIADTSVGIVYYFELTKPTEIFQIKFKNGEFILKEENFDDDNDNDGTIQYLKKLSKLKLIPKIYFIDKFPQNKNETSIIQIMEYVNGIDLEKLSNERNWSYYTNFDKELRISIWDKILKEYRKWNNFNVNHNDLQMKNILIENKNGTLNIVFIDPMFIDGDYDLSELERIKKKLLPWEFS